MFGGGEGAALAVSTGKFIRLPHNPVGNTSTRSMQARAAKNGGAANAGAG